MLLRGTPLRVIPSVNDPALVRNTTESTNRCRTCDSMKRVRIIDRRNQFGGSEVIAEFIPCGDESRNRVGQHLAPRTVRDIAIRIEVLHHVPEAKQCEQPLPFVRQRRSRPWRLTTEIGMADAGRALHVA